MQHPVSREEGSDVYNCCWPSQAQPFSGPSPAGLMTIFYSLRFETPQTWRTRSPYLYPPGTWWPCYNPRHWVPFMSSPTTHRAMMVTFGPATTRASPLIAVPFRSPVYSLGADGTENTAYNISSIVAFVTVATIMCGY
jgi:hypothetical protein